MLLDGGGANEGLIGTLFLWLLCYRAMMVYVIEAIPNFNMAIEDAISRAIYIMTRYTVRQFACWLHLLQIGVNELHLSNHKTVTHTFAWIKMQKHF